MSEKFTPGPWKWEGSIYENMSAGVRAIPDDRGICQVWQHDNAVADAMLISAAPDMVATLTAMLAWVKHWQDDVAGNLKPTPSSLSEARDRIVAVLAKATP